MHGFSEIEKRIANKYSQGGKGGVMSPDPLFWHASLVYNNVVIILIWMLQNSYH